MSATKTLHRDGDVCIFYSIVSSIEVARSHFANHLVAVRVSVLLG